MNYKLGKYLPFSEEFEFVFDDGRWVNIDLVNDFPNYIHWNKSLVHQQIKSQTNYDKKCHNENPYSDNGLVYLILFNLYNENIKITLL